MQKIWKQIVNILKPKNDVELYLSKATDHFDLERRIVFLSRKGIL
jgi:hypothetical protein